MNGPVNRLVTHSGYFHLDDVAAFMVLRSMYPFAELVRTRDEDLIRPAAGTIVFDVGGLYDPQANIFDHHQHDKALREDGTPYSAFGLVWKHFGEQYLHMMMDPPIHVQDVWQTIDREIVQVIDAIDNGFRSPKEMGISGAMSLSSIVESMASRDPMKINDDFIAAANLVRTFFEAKVARIQELCLDADYVHDKIVENMTEKSPILTLDRYVDPTQAIIDAGDDAAHILYIVKPNLDGSQWQLSCARDDPESYVNRADIPQEFYGKTPDEIEYATGIAGLAFIHTGLFFAAGEEGAIKDLAVKSAERVLGRSLEDTAEMSM